MCTKEASLQVNWSPLSLMDPKAGMLSVTESDEGI